MFSGTNADPASVLPGIDTLLLSASATPVPDIVALAATASSDGIASLGGPSQIGAFAVATVNVGAGGAVTATRGTGGKAVPVTLALCQKDPGSGQCLSGPAGRVTTPIAAGETPTFAIFVTGT